MVTLRQVREDQGVLTLDGAGSATRDGGRRRECGQVVVVFALLLPMLLVLTAVVLDIGNWYVHKKNLQTLVDAGAFAGATKFVGCSFQFGDPVAANAATKATALAYSGDTVRDPATKNRQLQEPAHVRVVLNSARYWTEGDPTNGGGLDDTLDADGDPSTPGDPCSSKTLDVKATEHNAPLLTGLIPIFPDIKSKARVEIRQVVEQAGMLPWAVPEVDLAAVVAIFVDENTGNVLRAQRLMKMDDPNLPFLEWATSPPTDPFNVSRVDLASENTGVVILVSKINNTPSVSGTLTQICGQSSGLVKCYAGDGNQDGLTFIHGWSDAPGSPATAQIRNVWLQKGTCGDDLSAPYFLRAGDCDLGVTAFIDFGVGGDPTKKPSTGISAQVTLKAPGCGGGGCPMTWQSTTGTESLWITTNNSPTLAADLGRATFSITWSTSTGSGTFAGVAHPYVADDRSGPIEYLKLKTVDSGILDANSRYTGDPPLASVIVTVGLRKPFQVESPLAPPVVLRVASPSGSQNQAFNCDASINFENEIEHGCQTTYRENYGDWNKDGVNEWRDILCADYPNGAGLPPGTFAPSPVPDCVRVETGDKIGQFRQGLTARLKNPSCAPNNWPEDPADFHDFFTKYDFANDPRYVSLIVTDYGTFLGSGSSEAVPVKYFAGFYITGWDKNGTNPECADNEPHPWYAPGYRKSLDNGDVWGHFINVVVFSSTGKPDDNLCNFDQIGTCIAVLVE